MYFRSAIAVLLACFVFTWSVCAQRAVLKDGHIIDCQGYKISGEKISCVSTQGKQASIALDAIDATQTHELNRRESSPPLNIPEQSTAVQTETKEHGQESLGELARKANHGQGIKNSKHVFTDDDVAHTQATANSSPSADEPSDLPRKIVAAQSVVDRAAGQKPRELSDAVVGENQFPGRDDWEQQLYRQKETMLSTARAALDALKMQLDAPTQEQRLNAGKAANSLYSDFTLEKYRYDQLVAEGVKKAADWERRRR